MFSYAYIKSEEINVSIWSSLAEELHITYASSYVTSVNFSYICQLFIMASETEIVNKLH